MSRRDVLFTVVVSGAGAVDTLHADAQTAVTRNQPIDFISAKGGRCDEQEA